jgi:hypothetical protein
MNEVVQEELNKKLLRDSLGNPIQWLKTNMIVPLVDDGYELNGFRGYFVITQDEYDAVRDEPVPELLPGSFRFDAGGALDDESGTDPAPEPVAVTWAEYACSVAVPDGRIGLRVASGPKDANGCTAGNPSHGQLALWAGVFGWSNLHTISDFRALLAEATAISAEDEQDIEATA